MATDKDTHTAVRDTARASETATRRAADAARTITDQGAEAGRRLADTGAKVGAEATQRGAETIRTITGSVAQAAEQTTDRFRSMMGFSVEAQGEVAQQARENMDAMVQCGSVLMDGMQSIWREWLGLAQDAMARNMDGVNAMMRSRSVQDFYSAQSEMVKDGVELLLNRSVTVSQLSAKTANDAVRRLNARVEEGARQTRRA